MIDSPEGGIYILRLTAEDTARVHVDGAEVLGAADGSLEETLVAEVMLAPGMHDLEVRYMDLEFEASLQVDRDHVRPLPAPTTPATAPDPDLFMTIAPWNDA